MSTTISFPNQSLSLLQEYSEKCYKNLPTNVSNIAIVGSRNLGNVKFYIEQLGYSKEKAYKTKSKLVDDMDFFIGGIIDWSNVNWIISGGAIGIDQLAENLAYNYNKNMVIIRPQWKIHGKEAGFIRNEQIISKGDVIFAFHDGKSQGTINAMSWAYKYKKPLFINNPLEKKEISK